MATKKRQVQSLEREQAAKTTQALAEEGWQQGLSASQVVFVRVYTLTFDASLAYQCAKMPNHASASRGALAASAQRALDHPEVARAIGELLKAREPEETELVARVYRDVQWTMADFLGVDDHGQLFYDFKRASERGALAGIKKIKIKNGEVELELYDRLKALDLLLKQKESMASRAQAVQDSVDKAERKREILRLLRLPAAALTGGRPQEEES